MTSASTTTAPVDDGADIAGQVALVTGGAGGIGNALAHALAVRGVKVVCADRQGSRTTEPGIHSVALDVTDLNQVRGVVDDVVKREGRLDILVNVAGVVSFGSAEALSEEEWDRVLDINLKGTFLCCQAVIPIMRRQAYGRIVNLGSVVGKNAGNARPWIDAGEQQRASNVAYGVSKAGVHVMTGFLAKELAAAGITVNAVAPGPIATGMTTDFPPTLRQLIPVGRMGTIDDVVRAILFLASPGAGFISGAVVDVNGAMWCD